GWSAGRPGGRGRDVVPVRRGLLVKIGQPLGHLGKNLAMTPSRWSSCQVGGTQVVRGCSATRASPVRRHGRTDASDEIHTVAMEEVNTWRIIARTDVQRCASIGCPEGLIVTPPSPPGR